MSYEKMICLNPEDQMELVLSYARESNLVPSSMNPLRMRRLFEVFKSNYMALSDYTPNKYPGQITLFKAVHPVMKNSDNTSPGWANHSDLPVDVHYVPGNHYTMLSHPHVGTLAEKLKKCIDKCRLLFDNISESGI